MMFTFGRGDDDDGVRGCVTEIVGEKSSSRLFLRFLLIAALLLRVSY